MMPNEIAEPMNNKPAAGKAGLFVKIFISAGAIFWLLLSVEWDLLFQKISGINWLVLFLSFILYSVWIIPCSMRWRQIAASCGFVFSLKESARGYLIGAFFSAFLPTAKGGDLVRGVFMARDHGFPSGGLLATIIVERFIGLTMALLLVLFTSLIMASRYAVLNHIIVSASVLAFFLLAAVLVFFNCHFQKLLLRFIDMLPFTRIKNGSHDIFKVLDVCSKDPKLILSAMGFSLLNQLVLISAGYIMAKAIPGFNGPWISFGLVIPLNFIAVLLPSIGGYGIREAGFIIFFGWFGISGETAGLFGLLQLLFMWIFSLAGGICFIMRKSVKSA
jgi:uncharacterized membrane protein YbhN (UPF0104 family)